MSCPIIILHNVVEADAPIDERDVLVQAQAVEEALAFRGYATTKMGVDLGAIKTVMDAVSRARPYCVFNLVESLDRSEALMPLIPLLLETKAIPFTGATAQSMLATGNKTNAKKIMARAGLPTPCWHSAQEVVDNGIIAYDPPYIVKSCSGHGSVDLEAGSIFDSADDCMRRIRQIDRAARRWLMVERFIDGREFNISLVQIGGKLRVMPPAEISFADWAPQKPKIIGYRAKWDQASWEYQHTPRRFSFPEADALLLQRLEQLCADCWDLFGLRGYARIDFRVDSQNRPWILEVNVNPCLSPDAGLAAAAMHAGMDYQSLVENIAQSAACPLD